MQHHGTTAVRVVDGTFPYPEHATASAGRAPWEAADRWPCAWIAPLQHVSPPAVVGYRRRFAVEWPATVRVHVSADERYELFLDGVRVGRGPERGDRVHWAFETYDLLLAAGEHVLAASVVSAGKLAPWAQMSVYHGLIVAAEGDAWIQRIGTGVAAWEAKPLQGYTLTDPGAQLGMGVGSGPCYELDAARHPWGWEAGAEDDG